ncbi:DgyrCDS8283 [Dimorphilus gyrociliatus]|uniref:DgyrCDS8283 n=1 Tax=Dimorphilus gyrociliatus TaxID=2664684 RepID=A0A7I8VVE5_9ANNE|nr:DgyrCDS8283 [Dimorphilus gyrociliatus]
MENSQSSPTPSTISMSEIHLQKENTSITIGKKKEPRRRVYCSDGVYEEYSTDEEEPVELPPPVDPKTLTWAPWIGYYFRHVGLKTLNAADYLGEKLAWFFGITSPKYQYIIDEVNRRNAEENESSEFKQREYEAEKQRESEKTTKF